MQQCVRTCEFATARFAAGAAPVQALLAWPCTAADACDSLASAVRCARLAWPQAASACGLNDS